MYTHVHVYICTYIWHVLSWEESGNMSLISVTSFTVQDGVSPLYVASQNGHTDVVDLLVKAGADVPLTTTEVYAYMLCGSQSYSVHTYVDWSVHNSHVISGPHILRAELIILFSAYYSFLLCSYFLPTILLITPIILFHIPIILTKWNFFAFHMYERTNNCCLLYRSITEVEI